VWNTCNQCEHVREAYLFLQSTTVKSKTESYSGDTHDHAWLELTSPDPSWHCGDERNLAAILSNKVVNPEVTRWSSWCYYRLISSRNFLYQSQNCNAGLHLAFYSWILFHFTGNSGRKTKQTITNWPLKSWFIRIHPNARASGDKCKIILFTVIHQGCGDWWRHLDCLNATFMAQCIKKIAEYFLGAVWSLPSQDLKSGKGEYQMLLSAMKRRTKTIVTGFSPGNVSAVP